MSVDRSAWEDQVGSAFAESSRFLQRIAGLAGDMDVKVGTLFGEGARASTIEFYRRFMAAYDPPKFCSHIMKAPTQSGYWMPGVEHLVRCMGCVGEQDPLDIAIAEADMHCELCFQPTTVFHPDAFAMGYPHGGGATIITIAIELCPRCHIELGLPLIDE